MESVGEYLKKERESRGVTIEEICDVTRITRRFIVAIEADDFDLMSGDTFVVGFLRSYAKVIGVDSDEVVGKYYAYLEEKKGDSVQDKVGIDTREGIGQRNILLMLFVLVLLVGSYFFSKGRNEVEDLVNRVEVEELSDSTPSTISENEGVSEEEVSHETALEPLPDIKPPPAEEKIAAKEELLTIRANEDAWIYIVIDTNDVKDILLKKGEKMNYRAKDSFLFTTGNLKGIEVIHNGRELSFPEKGKRVLKNYLITSANH